MIMFTLLLLFGGIFYTAIAILAYRIFSKLTPSHIPYASGIGKYYSDRQEEANKAKAVWWILCLPLYGVARILDYVMYNIGQVVTFIFEKLGIAFIWFNTIVNKGIDIVFRGKI